MGALVHLLDQKLALPPSLWSRLHGKHSCSGLCASSGSFHSFGIEHMLTGVDICRLFATCSNVDGLGGHFAK